MAQSEADILRPRIGTDIYTINVQQEIANTMRDVLSGGLSPADKQTALNYVARLRGQVGTPYDGGSGWQSTIDKFFGGTGTDPAGEKKPGWSDMVDAVIRGDNPVGGGKQIDNPGNIMGTVADKGAALLGNVSLVALGIGISVVAIYFAAKKMG